MGGFLKMAARAGWNYEIGNGKIDRYRGEKYLVIRSN